MWFTNARTLLMPNELTHIVQCVLTRDVFISGVFVRFERAFAVFAKMSCVLLGQVGKSGMRHS